MVARRYHLLQHRFALKMKFERFETSDGIAYCDQPISPRIRPATVFDPRTHSVRGPLRKFRPQVLQRAPNLNLNRVVEDFDDDMDGSIPMAWRNAAILDHG